MKFYDKPFFSFRRNHEQLPTQFNSSLIISRHRSAYTLSFSMFCRCSTNGKIPLLPPHTRARIQYMRLQTMLDRRTKTFFNYIRLGCDLWWEMKRQKERDKRISVLSAELWTRRGIWKHHTERELILRIDLTFKKFTSSFDIKYKEQNHHISRSEDGPYRHINFCASSFTEILLWISVISRQR